MDLINLLKVSLGNTETIQCNIHKFFKLRNLHMIKFILIFDRSSG